MRQSPIGCALRRFFDMDGSPVPLQRAVSARLALFYSGQL
jgi:hypothetical protein